MIKTWIIIFACLRKLSIFYRKISYRFWYWRSWRKQTANVAVAAIMINHVT